VTTRYGYAGAWGYGAGAWDGDPACQAWEGGQPAPGGDTWGDCASPLGTPCCDPIAELGWLHVGERYYDPAAGRFVQRDPIGIAGGANAYFYANNAPVLLIDPDGLAWYNPFDYGPIARGTLWITGGSGHVPVLDPGTAQDIVQVTAEVTSLLAPVGACVRVVTMGAKAVRAAQQGSRIARGTLRLRRVIRLDRPHHGKGWHLDGWLFGGR